MSESPITKNPEDGNSLHSESSTAPPLYPKSEIESQANNTDKEKQGDDTIEVLQIEKRNINDATSASASNSNIRRFSNEITEPIKDSIPSEDNGVIYNDSPSRRSKTESNSISEKMHVTPGTVEINSNKLQLFSEKHEKKSMSTECLNQTKIPATIVSKNQNDFSDSELGIVGLATAARDVLSVDELVDPPEDEEVQCHVTQWIEKSSRHNITSKMIKNTSKGVVTITTALQQPSRKSQRIVTSIIKRSIKCLNKMHAMDCGTTSTTSDDKNVDEKKVGDKMSDSLRIPQNRQNGAALPEETATATSAATSRIKIENLSSIESGTTIATVKKENHSESEDDITEVKKKPKTNGKEVMRKRRSNDNSFSANGNPKSICVEQRERYIDSLVGCERISAEELATRADELRAELQALDELARVKEMEWNEILSMRKLKEEAYLRLKRKRQVMSFLDSNSSMTDSLPPASLSVLPEWEESCREHRQELRDNQESSNTSRMNNDEKFTNQSQSEAMQESSRRMTDEDFARTIVKRDNETPGRHQKSLRNVSSASSSKLYSDNGRKQRRSIDQSMENRQIGEGRQGPTVDVRSIIADYRLRHPEMVPRRGRRMRNSVNIGLGTGGAMVDTSHGDSRPSSTDSCKSNNNASDVNNAMSFKDVLVQFAKLSQQQGEPVKTPQNYPDVTLHPVAPSPTIMNSSTTSHQTGSLLHGILTKSQSPRPTTFSPTLARLLTTSDRDRNISPSGSVGQHQPTQAQQLLQSYQGSNSVTISDLLSSSKARTEITITPVVNTPLQSTPSNNIVHVDDVEEENSLAEERDTRRNAGGRDNREDRDIPPRCQGCHERAAQFVCAGCSNQWYCSRDCQVLAWETHSEVCSG